MTCEIAITLESLEGGSVTSADALDKPTLLFEGLVIRIDPKLHPLRVHLFFYNICRTGMLARSSSIDMSERYMAYLLAFWSGSELSSSPPMYLGSLFFSSGWQRVISV